MRSLARSAGTRRPIAVFVSTSDMGRCWRCLSSLPLPTTRSIYGQAYDWKIPVLAINGWLAAAVVQLFIIIRGLGRYLFPPIKPTNDLQDRP
jgi:hypothetical protein